jgi:hypothetical protein
MSLPTSTFVEEDPTTVEQLISRVLPRAHRDAEDLHAPGDARTILGAAHSI